MTEPSPDAPVLPEPSLPPRTPSGLDLAPTLPPAAPGVDLAPTLAPPAPDVDLAPTLPPAAPPRAPSHTEEQLFDAKAMVEATTAHVANPSYGPLPTATEESLEAQQRLRAQARRKRQRNRSIAWLVVVVFVGGIGAAGWLGYQAWRDDQDRQQAARAAAQAAVDGDSVGIAPGALTPLGNQQAIIEALEDINSSDASPSGGGLRDIVDRAQDVVAEHNGPPPTAAIDPSPAAVEDRPLDPTPAIRPDYRTIGFDVRYYDSAAAGADFTHYSYTYDVDRDDYYASVKRPSDRTASLLVFFEAWRHTLEADGSVTRVPRSEASLDPDVDTPLAATVTELDVVPVAARAHAVTTSIEEIAPATLVGFDGGALTAHGLRLDVAAFAESDPQAHEDWSRFWTSGRIDGDHLVEPGVRQRRTEDMTADFLSEFDPIDFDALETATAPDGLAAIVYLVTEHGLIQQAMIVSPPDDMRVIYTVAEISDEASALLVGGEWVDVP